MKLIEFRREEFKCCWNISNNFDLFSEMFHVYSISVGDVGEIVPYSLFVQLNIGGINHFHFTTNKPKDQGRTGFMKLVIVKGWFIKRHRENDLYDYGLFLLIPSCKVWVVIIMGRVVCS